MKERWHSVEEVKTDLQIDEQLNLQEKGWIAQRVGLFAIITIALLAAVGLFGGGLLSNKSITSGNIKAQYEKMYRYETEMKVLVESPAHVSSISFPQRYLKDFRIVRFVPEPENNTTTAVDVKFNFLPGDNRIVTIYLIPKSYGTISGIMKVNETNAFNLKHFIFP